MRVPSKTLDGRIRAHFPDGTVNRAKSACTRRSPDWVVSDNKKQINWFSVVDRIQEPGLLNKIFGFDYFRHVRISSEVKENPKGHDSKSCTLRVNHL